MGRVSPHSPETRTAVVREALEGTEPVRTICAKYGVPLPTARTWVRKAKGKYSIGNYRLGKLPIIIKRSELLPNAANPEGLI